MRRVHVDTHIVIWLAERRTDRIRPAAAQLNGAQLVASPMVLLELEYLHEIGRIGLTPDEVLGIVTAECGMSVSDAKWTEVVRSARSLRWTRDPFDRLIVANALVDGCPFITADHRILTHCDSARFG